MKRITRGLAVIVGLMLLVLALTGGAAPRRAEAQYRDYTLHVRFSHRSKPQNGILCLGFPYEIVADTIRWELDAFDPANAPNPLPYVPRPVTESWVYYADADLGKILPIRSRSNIRGPAIFNFIPTSTGKESLHFWSTAGPITANLAPRVFASEFLDIEVKKCNLKVEMIYDAALNAGSLTSHYVAILDEITLEADETGHLEGEGTTAFHEFMSLPGGVCSDQVSALDMPTSITGTIVDDRIELQFDIQGGEVTHTISCPFTTTSASGDYPSLFITSASVPIEGGIVTIPSGSSGPIQGAITLIVTREDDEQATSDAGSQALAALSAWFAGWPGVME
jgi:hypothetical protein